MRLLLYSFSLGLLLLTACSSKDLAFINEVKTFEPRWMDLSEKFTYVKRNLSLTQTRYPEDLQQIKPLFDRAPAGANSQLTKLERQYREMEQERDAIKENYEALMSDFVATVQGFNEWETSLMKNGQNKEEAGNEFEAYQQKQAALLDSVNTLQSRLVQNVERHNKLMQSMSQILGVYTSYQIDPK